MPGVAARISIGGARTRVRADRIAQSHGLEPRRQPVPQWNPAADELYRQAGPALIYRSI